MSAAVLRIIGATLMIVLGPGWALADPGTARQDLRPRYQRAAERLPFNIPDLLVQDETWDTRWSSDGQTFAWRRTGRGEDAIVQGDIRTGTLYKVGDWPDFARAEESVATFAPDRRMGVAVHRFDLYLRDVVGTAVRRLTLDGREDKAYSPYHGFGYIDESVRREQADGRFHPARGLWSSDGRHFVTYRYDQTAVGQHHYWKAVGEAGYGSRGEMVNQRVPYPADQALAWTELVVVDALEGTVTTVPGSRAQNMVDPFDAGLMQWSADGRTLFFIHEGRGLRRVEVRSYRPGEKDSRLLFSESSSTYLMLSGERYPAIWRVLGDGSRMVWFSERDGWGNLYLVDLRSGKLIRPITTGKGVVRKLLKVDERAGTVLLIASGRAAGVDPYFRQLYEATLDGSRLRLLTPEPADHDVSLPLAGDSFIDVRTAGIASAPEVLLRDRASGKVRKILATMDLDPLKRSGWIPPQRLVLRDADDRLDVLVNDFRPADHDPGRTYPVVDFIYGLSSLAETPVVFPAGADHGLGRYYWRAQTLAELGFIVVMLDAPGTPLRGHAYARQSYGEGHVDSTLRHHVAAIRQLAERDKSIDLQRVGITGHSGGGFASTRALLLYPDFFKVAVSSAGSHDLGRLYGAEWTDRYIGPYEENVARYERLSNTTYANQLRGKLLLAHGEADDEVSIAMTQQLVHALIAANKDFEMLYVPNANHGMSNDPYFIRRQWDFLVKHLGAGDPPADFRVRRP